MELKSNSFKCIAPNFPWRILGPPSSIFSPPYNSLCLSFCNSNHLNQVEKIKNKLSPSCNFSKEGGNSIRRQGVSGRLPQVAWLRALSPSNVSYFTQVSCPEMLLRRWPLRKSTWLCYWKGSFQKTGGVVSGPPCGQQLSSFPRRLPCACNI